MSKTLLPLFRDVAIALAVVLIVLFFIGPTIVYGSSMEKTLQEKDYVICAKQAYAFSDIKHGDIVIFKSELEEVENGGKKNLIKRVIAVPGDTIEIKDEKVFLNGKELVEPYIKDGVTNGSIEKITIGDGLYFTMGDNRLKSKDSRATDVGLVSENDIIGKVIFRLFPLSEIGTL